MKNETHQISDILPVDPDLFGGEISMAGDFSFNQTYSAKSGDLLRTGFEMISEFGNADCMMLGKRHYFAISETYRYKRGLCCKTRIDQPIIELHFQLDGEARDIQLSQSVADLKLDIRHGEANLMIVPPLSDSFELKEEMGGRVFSIMLSKEYLTDLSNRFPHHMEPILTKIKQEDFCFFREQNLRITPRMLGVIQRIQSYDDGYIAGSLFLEAQILELFSLFFSQAEQHAASSNGYFISRSDRERLHRAREILLEMDNPPTLAELSRILGTNEYKLKRGFKELFGTSPYAFHLQHKLEQARTYILDTNLTIAEIAYRVGYRDPAHLTNAFRKQYGICPSDLRS